MESYEELFTSTKAYLIQERLEEIRKYLTQTCYGEYVIGENVDKVYNTNVFINKKYMLLYFRSSLKMNLSSYAKQKTSPQKTYTICWY